MNHSRLKLLGSGLVLAIGLAMVSWLFFGPGQVNGEPDAPDPGPLPAVALEPAFPHLKFELPLWVGAAPADSGFLYVAEQNGRIWRFKNDPAIKDRELWLDIAARIPAGRHNEEGLLALAFHPKFAENRQFFVCYNVHEGAGKPRRSVLARFIAPAAGAVDTATERILLEVQQPYGNHKGCTLVFGPDSYLYISLGDGGSAGDPHGHGQNLSTLLATVCRIDVDKEGPGKRYAIPADNPFVGRADAAPEIWAYGLRNVWRMAFDRETGLLWGGDVGQNAREEVDIIERGGNYGWNAREGMIAFRDGQKAPGMIDPVAEYPRDKGVSVVGGSVYRGKKHAALAGVYLYADYYTGRLWGLTWDVQEKRVTANELLGHFPAVRIASFGEDEQGEVLVCNHLAGTLHRLTVK